jgi:hypothetical protein
VRIARAQRRVQHVMVESLHVHAAHAQTKACTQTRKPARTHARTHARINTNTVAQAWTRCPDARGAAVLTCTGCSPPSSGKATTGALGRNRR